MATQEQTESEEKKERGEGGGGGERTHMRSPPLRNRPNSGLFPLSSSVFSSSSEAYFEVSIRARKFWNGERAQCERKRERERGMSKVGKSCGLKRACGIIFFSLLRRRGKIPREAKCEEEERGERERQPREFLLRIFQKRGRFSFFR